MPTATISDPSVLTSRDFDDPARYVVVRAVPVFDAHESRSKGDVDEPMLRLLAENSNDRARRGHPPNIIVGHTSEDDPEDRQPITVGVALSFRVATFDGRPTIFADFHIERRHIAQARTFPFRSIERIRSVDPSWNVIAAIALLRREPDRKLGFTRWPAA